ncbi:MAG: PASTA domain-containing protein [Acidimicrobiales bacterium]
MSGSASTDDLPTWTLIDGTSEGAGWKDAASPTPGATAAARTSALTAPSIYKPRRGRHLKVSRKAALVAVVVLLLAGGAAFGAVQTQLFVPSHRIPDLGNLTATQASAKLRRDRINLKVVRHRYSASVASGGIVREIPAAGTSLKEGSTVSAVVSTGPPPVSVTSLSGITSGGCSSVVAALASAHLHANCQLQHDTQVPDGGVIRWTPTGRAPEFSTVTVSISEGPPIETIPNLDNLTCAAATSTLQVVGLQANCEPTYTTSGTQTGYVIPSSWQPSGSAPQGATVTIPISKGPPLVPVPAVTAGETLGEMTQVLQSAGLTAGTVYGPGSGTVFATNPSYPASEPEGTAIGIYTN